MILQEFSDELLNVAESAAKQLRAIDGNEIAGSSWTRKQILGHLIDSAANNHHRFVRAQDVAELRFPSYDQCGTICSSSFPGLRTKAGPDRAEKIVGEF